MEPKTFRYLVEPEGVPHFEPRRVGEKFSLDFTAKTDSLENSMSELELLTRENPDLITDWRELAACRDHPNDLFFPAGETGPAAVQIEKAKGICGTCEVSDECLLFALESNQRDGIWGGLTADERRRLRRRWLAERRRSAG